MGYFSKITNGYLRGDIPAAYFGGKKPKPKAVRKVQEKCDTKKKGGK